MREHCWTAVDDELSTLGEGLCVRPMRYSDWRDIREENEDSQGEMGEDGSVVAVSCNVPTRVSDEQEDAGPDEWEGV